MSEWFDFSVEIESMKEVQFTVYDGYVDRCTGTRADCSRAFLTAVPPDLPYNTAELILRNNRISNINDETLQNLKNLSSLDLQDNLLSVVLSDSLPRNLQKLNLAENAFQCSEQASINLTSLQNLKELDLSHNNIELCIPGNLPVGLEVLRLNRVAYNGNLTLSPRQFEHLPALRLLSLEDNNVVEFPGEAIGKLSALTELSLARNRLRVLSDMVLPSLVKLQLLDLSFNDLGQVDTKSFSGIEKSSLMSLSLSGNRMNTVAPSAFSQMPKLTNLTMDQNPWNCGCDLLPLREWLENATVRELLGIAEGHVLNCETPDDLKGQMVSKVPLHYFCGNSSGNTTVPPSTTVHQTTLPTNVTTAIPPTLPPENKLFNFSIDSISEQTVQLSWASNDPHVEFQVSWSSEHSSVRYSGWENGTSFGINSLTPDTKYHICLMAALQGAVEGKEVESSCVSIITIAKHHSVTMTPTGLGLIIALSVCIVIAGLGFFLGRRFKCRRKNGGYHSMKSDG
ncbi:PREDICTED: slit homolog 1 protein-like [Branchiostoma belcheri]|uniref:Slit homolog 1 protein-like n=1 Tax=Branchiostoma belcheri TaxID=7741 RepID=A0A6P4XNR0_BRABE|nr:PREDICTED: slit homolog 1 protein-like [Branchiostoma belcheri]